MKKTVALLFGGRGAEHAVSCRSAAAILRAIDPEKYKALPVGIARDGNFFIYSGSPERIENETWHTDDAYLTPTFPVRYGKESGFALGRGLLTAHGVLPVLHGDFGEDGTVQGLLACAGLPYLGCDVCAGAVCADKALTKRLAESVGVAVVPWCRLPAAATTDITEDAAVRALHRVRAHIPAGVPLFLKPVGMGSSFGASPVREDAHFPDAYRKAARYGAVLAEEFLHPVRELEVAYLCDADREIFSHPGQILPEGFYSYEEKYGESHAQIETHAPLDEATAQRIRRCAQKLVRVCGVRDLCRIDFFLSGERLYFNEINTFPGFTAISLYPRLLEKEGYTFAALIDALIQNVLHRGV